MKGLRIRSYRPSWIDRYTKISSKPDYQSWFATVIEVYLRDEFCEARLRIRTCSLYTVNFKWNEWSGVV